MAILFLIMLFFSQKASTAISGRDEQIEEVSEEIEINLELVGATAIEDKL